MTASDPSFPANLARDLKGPLPGAKAQLDMAPKPRNGARRDDRPRPGAKLNGVLILFYPCRGEICLPLILRPTYPGVHSGQVSLPGGRREPADADVVDTALREAAEEIGVQPADVQILGQLSPIYIAASNNIVYPSVGWTERRPDFCTDAREVAMLIEAPLREFLKPGNLSSETRELNGQLVVVPYFRVCNQIVWGATAMILGELLALPSIRALRQNTDQAGWRPPCAASADGP